MRHILSVLVENKFGVLSRVAGLFAGRGFNINSLAVAATENDDISNMIITVKGDEQIIEQVKKQLNRLIETIKVVDLTDQSHVERELMLIRVNSPAKNRSEIYQLTEIFRGTIVDVQPKTLTIEVTGNPDKIDAFVESLKPYGIKEVSRTGRIAMLRGR